MDQFSESKDMADNNIIKKNIELSPLTTFKIGGGADFFCEPKNIDELKFAIDWAKSKNIPFFILGGGSNILFSDDGFRGLIIKNKIDSFEIIEGDNKNIILKIGAGKLLSSVVKLSIDNNWEGMEWAIGIPGTISGATMGNAGAYGESMADSIIKVEGISRDLEFKTIESKDCGFSYRKSDLRDLLTSISFVYIKLKRGDKEKIDLKIKENILSRKNKIPPYPSAGCVFKNVLAENLRNDILKKIPSDKIIYGKIPAGWLIEESGLKGKIIGGAKVSEMHSNFIVNYSNAKAKDVLDLINLCKKEVRNNFRIDLEEEILLIGL